MLGMPGLPYCLNTAYNLLIIKSDIILLLVTKLRLREIGSWSFQVYIPQAGAWERVQPRPKHLKSSITFKTWATAMPLS